MSADQSSSKKPRSTADRLERQLDKVKAHERKKFLNENILRLEKNGDLSYQAVRTYALPAREGEAPAEPHKPEAQARGPAADQLSDFHGEHHTDVSENPAISNLLPNKLPESPALQENGNLIPGVARAPTPERWSREANHGSAADAQPQACVDVKTSDAIAATDQNVSPNAGISCHEGPPTGNQHDPEDTDPLKELLHRALLATKTRRGRPSALDDQAKGQLIALLSVGMSMRQAAAVLGVSHTTVQNTLKADPALADDITAARFQAQLQPLACVIREARRSWKAATWLLKYLDGKIASHEETPDERRQRQERESEEFFARAAGHNVKTRRVLG